VATVATPADTYVDLRTPLLGLYQADNLALAVAAIDGLRSRGWEISDGALRDGLSRARWPGRLEVVARRPTVLVDGAHNPAALARVLPTVQRLRDDHPLVIVFGAMADKDLPSMLAELRQADAPVIFSGINWHRAAQPGMLAELYGRPAAIAPGVAPALAQARQLAGGEGIVLVCGSLYLVGEVIQLVAPGARAGIPTR
jgi:dihydrofolate synthase/folylpolyglutamate synthase